MLSLALPRLDMREAPNPLTKFSHGVGRRWDLDQALGAPFVNADHSEVGS